MFSALPEDPYFHFRVKPSVRFLAARETTPFLKGLFVFAQLPQNDHSALNKRGISGGAERSRLEAERRVSDLGTAAAGGAAPPPDAKDGDGALNGPKTAV